MEMRQTRARAVAKAGEIGKQVDGLVDNLTDRKLNRNTIRKLKNITNCLIPEKCIATNNKKLKINIEKMNIESFGSSKGQEQRIELKSVSESDQGIAPSKRKKREKKSRFVETSLASGSMKERSSDSSKSEKRTRIPFVSGSLKGKSIAPSKSRKRARESKSPETASPPGEVKDRIVARSKGGKRSRKSKFQETVLESGSMKNNSIEISKGFKPRNESKSSETVKSSLNDELCKIISRKYVDVADRLKIKFPLRCLEDPEFCLWNHCETEAPESPIHDLAMSFKLSYEQGCYVTFLKLAFAMCRRNELPKKILTYIVEIILSVNPVKDDKDCLQYIYEQSIELFLTILCKFPPCWAALRPVYQDFLISSLNISKIAPSRKDQSNTIFEAIIDLLELIVKQEERINEDDRFNEIANSNLNISALSEDCITFRQWEQREKKHQSFDSISTNDAKLERLFVVLQMLSKILENDLGMWILRHYKDPTKWLFCQEEKPLIVRLFKMTNYSLLTPFVRKIIELFAVCIKRGLRTDYLCTLERFISQIAFVCNISEIIATPNGIKYLELGPKTKAFIQDFYKIFKAHCSITVEHYMVAIDLLHIPFVRYEFINIFLNSFHSDKSEMSPEKIAIHMNKLYWKQYQPGAQVSKKYNALTREQYLNLLLTALRDYCDWHASKAYFLFDTPEPNASTNTWSKDLRQPPGKYINLQLMAKNISKLELDMNMKVEIAKPNVELAAVKILVDDLFLRKYRTDLKYLAILNLMIPKQMALPEAPDFSKWIEFLKDFAPKSY